MTMRANRLRNPLPMGTSAAVGQSTPAMQQQIGMAYGGSSRGTSRRRGKKKSATRSRATKRKSGGRKLKFGSKAWRAKYAKKGKRK